MAKSGGPTVGLDIGSYAIKAVELAPGRNGVVVKALGMAPTPPGSVESNVIVDAQLLGQAVKKMLRESGISVKSSVSSVSGQAALVVRVIEVPKMSDAELAETMKWEVERHVPFATSEVIMDFQPIVRADDDPNAQSMEVLLAVAQQDMVDRHVEMLFAAGLKPAAVDVEPLAVSRSLIELGPDPYGQRTLAVVNIGANNTDVSIFRDGLLAFPRTLPLAGEAITRAIATQMGVSPEQAEELKRQHGEVIMDQMQPAQPQAASDAFLDFSAPAAEEPLAPPPPPPPPPSASGGRMPFDFSDAEEGPTLAGGAASSAPSSAGSAFDLSGEPVGGEFDLSGEPVESAATADFDLGGEPALETPFDMPPPHAGATEFDLGSEPTPSAAAISSVPAVQYDPTKLQVFAAMAPVLSELVTELRRSLDYYRGRASDGRIDEILLCGGTSKIKNIAPFLESELGIPARVADPLEYATVTSRNYSAEYLEEVSTSFAVAIGLAARDMVAGPAPVRGGRRGKKK